MAKGRLVLFFGLSFFLIILDQVTKVIVKGFDLFGINHIGMFPGQSIEVWGDFLRFTFVENPGMAFGIQWGPAKILLSLFSLIASVGLSYFLIKIRDRHPGVKTGICLILAGALGNMIDRWFYGVFYGESSLFYGKVVDFIQFDIPDVDFGPIYYTHFPVFNIADSCVTCGVIVLLLFYKHIPSMQDVLGKAEKVQPD